MSGFDHLRDLLDGSLTQDEVRYLLDTIDALTAERDAWMNGVADIVEPLGFDREAACGPADLLPGLRFLVEERDEARARVAELADWVRQYEMERDAARRGPAAADLSLLASIRQSMFDAARAALEADDAR